MFNQFDLNCSANLSRKACSQLGLFVVFLKIEATEIFLDFIFRQVIAVGAETKLLASKSGPRRFFTTIQY